MFSVLELIAAKAALRTGRTSDNRRKSLKIRLIGDRAALLAWV
jgi:hypothetical protein